MAKQTDGPSSNRVNMVAQGAVLEGTLRAEEDVRVSGRVIGAVRASARVVVASAGVIDGEVEAAAADVDGVVQGGLDVAEQLVLRSGARVEGTIKTGKLVIEDGAVFNGTCQMLRREAGPVQPSRHVASRPKQEGRSPRKRPEPVDGPTSSVASKARPAEQHWFRQGGIVALGVFLVTILAAGAYYGFGVIQGNGGSNPSAASPLETDEALAETAAIEAPDDASVLSISETPPPDPADFDPPIGAARQAAGLDRIAMEQARQRVLGRRAEPEVAALYQQAEAARQQGMALFGNGGGEQASRSFREARDLFSRMQQVLDEKDHALEQESPPDTTTTTAADLAEEVVPDSVVETPAAAVPEAEPETIPEEDSEAVLDEVRTVVRRLAGQLKRAIEQEDIASMQAFYYRGWESFFGEAEAIKAVVRSENIRLTAGDIVADVYLDLSYQDEADQPQQRTQAYVWTLRRMGEEWVLMKVASR